MTSTYSLRQMAGLVAASGDDATIESTFQILRGWSNRNIIHGERSGAGKTSPLAYSLEEVCRAAIMITLRRSLGIEGEALKEMGAKIAQYRRSNIGPGPANSNLHVDCAHLIKAAREGEDWRLRVFILRTRQSGEIVHSIDYGPVNSLAERVYSAEDLFALTGVLELRVSEILYPLLSAASA